MSESLENYERSVSLGGARVIRKIIKSGHSYVVTVPGAWVRAHVDPTNPHVTVRIDANGSYILDPLPGPPLCPRCANNTPDRHKQNTGHERPP